MEEEKRQHDKQGQDSTESFTLIPQLNPKLLQKFQYTQRLTVHSLSFKANIYKSI